MKRISVEEWSKEAEALFGKDKKKWRFKCVNCGEVQTLQEFLDHKIDNPDCRVHFSCIGRWVKGRGCSWTLGGFLQRHKVEVIDNSGGVHPIFELDSQDTTN